jgi:hypothetical protein
MLFKRLGTNAIAKTIRNSKISKKNQSTIAGELVTLFKSDNPLFNAKQFRQLCTGVLEKDPLFGWRESDE